MWTICKNCIRKEIMACASDPVEAKAEASVDRTREHAIFVGVFASSGHKCYMQIRFATTAHILLASHRF